MKKQLTIFFFLLNFISHAQVIRQEYTDEMLESNIDETADVVDDSFIQRLEHFRDHPLNINSCSSDDLLELGILSALQVKSFIGYRSLFGMFINIYELQSIPTWDIRTVKKILPFIEINDPTEVIQALKARFRKGENNFILFYGNPGKNEEVRNTSIDKYSGNLSKLVLRYKYNFNNLLQFGMLCEKDPGEEFFKGSQKKGFDFYSIHFFARKLRYIKSLAIGDFTVNLGQGLIQWQGMAFKKSGEVLQVKRQSQVLRPYQSAGEYNFHRGIGLTFELKKFQVTVFASHRFFDSNLVEDSNTHKVSVSSLLTSGLHRTTNELKDRNNLAILTFGGNIKWEIQKFSFGINTVSYEFSHPFKKEETPYNLFSVDGLNWKNYSIDFSYTFRNFHIYGESALDKNRGKAFLFGLLASIDPKIDLSFVYRNTGKTFQSFFSNAFTENANPGNERGSYAGLQLRPGSRWRVDAYADLFVFPWLKYRVDAPSSGKDFLIKITYTPNKKIEISTRYRNKVKCQNEADTYQPTRNLISICTQNWRSEIDYKVNNYLSVRHRIHFSWYDRLNDKSGENGFLFYSDVFYKRSFKPFSGNMRVEYFETTGYEARIYAYENDVLYNFSIPPLFNKGFRYYLNLKFDISPKFHFHKKVQSEVWMRWSRTLNLPEPNPQSIKGKNTNEIKIQIISKWI